MAGSKPSFPAPTHQGARTALFGRSAKHQVRHSNEATDLWLLRGAVFDALSPRGTTAAHRLRVELQHALESVMPGGNDHQRDLLMAF